MKELEIILNEYNYFEVDDIDFYTDVFSLDKDYLQRENKDNDLFKTNPIGIGMNKGEKPMRRILFRDTFFDVLKELQETDFSILSGLTYFGKKNTLNNASKAHALIFDIDDVSKRELENFVFGIKNNVYPNPNYIILSGHGIHVYYVFKEPVSLYPMIKLALKDLKFKLTDLMWNQYTSKEKNKQFQGINQGFRIVGSKTKLNTTVRAFKSSFDYVDIDYLNSFLPDNKKVDFSKLYKETIMSLEEAKKEYPEWYENVVLKGQKKHWVTHEGLYNWWLEKIKNETTFGHRYYAVMALAIYAIKSNIPFERLEKDAYSLIPAFNEININEPFTESDVKSALECYDPNYRTFPRADIEKITAIEIPENKRNYRTQDTHLKLARGQLAILRELGEVQEGRPSKENLVKDFIKENPDLSVTEIARELNVSRPTVYKYLKKSKD